MLSVLKKKYYNLVSDKKFSEILTGSVYSVAAQTISVIMTLIVNVIVARVYGAAATGVLAMVNSFLFLIAIFTVMGTNTSILRLIPEHVAKYSVSSAFRIYRKIQCLVAGVSFATGITFFFASGIIAVYVFSKPHLSFLFALAAVFVIFKSLMDLNTEALRGLRLIRTFALMQVIPSTIMLIILSLATLIYRRPNNPVYAQFLAFALTAVIGVWIMDRAFKSRIQPDDLVQPVRVSNIISISMPMLMTASMFFFLGQAGIIMLGMFRSDREVGFYSMALKLSMLTSFILLAINSMAAPKFSELYHIGKLDELFYIAKKSTKLIFWTTVPILLMLIIFGKFILVFMFGKDFIVAYPAMFVLIIGQFVNSISGSTAYFMNMTGNQKVFMNVIFYAALLNIGLNWALIPYYGINGAAWAGMISLVFWNVYVLVYIKEKYGKSIGYVPILM